MSSPSDPVKKIVSKGEYAQIQSVRAGKMLWGILLLIACLACAIFTLFVWLWMIQTLGGEDSGRAFWAGIFACLAVPTSVLTYMLGKTGADRIQEAEQIEHVVPLTKANAPYLPAQESLVRASAEPPIAPETVLLRAVVDNTTTLPEQLVRPSTTPEQT